MPIVTEGMLFSVNWKYFVDDQTTLLTHHYILRAITGGSGPTIGNVQAALELKLETPTTGVSAKVANCYTSVASGGRITNQIIYPIRYIKRDSAAYYLTGQNTGYSVAMPANVATALTLRGIVADKRNRGTKHLGAVGDNFVDQSRVTAAGFTAYNALGAALVAEQTVIIGGVTMIFAPVLFNKDAPAASPFVESYTTQPTTRIERRRTVGLGV